MLRFWHFTSPAVETPSSSSSESDSASSSSSAPWWSSSSRSSVSLGSVILSSSSESLSDIEEPLLNEVFDMPSNLVTYTSMPPLVNHVRTLLLNRQKEGARLSDYGEEYISEEFVPRLLNRPISRVHQILFGQRPDRLFLNYRMRQIMQMMHATPLSEDITAYSPRLSYLPFKDDLFDTAFRTTVKQLAGTAHITHIAGTYKADMGNGVAEQVWDVTVLSPGYVMVTRRRFPALTQLVVVDDENTAILLPGSELLFYLHDAPPGYLAQITATAKPQFNIAELLGQMINIAGETGLADIFPPQAEEPVVTWHNIYRNSHEAPMKFTALLLAVADRTMRLPQRNDL